MRTALLCLVLGLTACTKHDLDPTIQPYVWHFTDKTVFPDTVPPNHLVCIETWHNFKTHLSCMSLMELRQLYEAHARTEE